MRHSIHERFYTVLGRADGYAGMGVLFFFGGYTYLLSSVTLHSGIISTFNFIKKWHIWDGGKQLQTSVSIVLLQYFRLLVLLWGLCRLFNRSFIILHN